MSTIKFECLESCGGRCCKSQGKGFIFLTKKDMIILENFTKKDHREFAKQSLFNFTRFSAYPGTHWHMKQTDECIFFKDGKCSVYEARPIQCRTFPFWPEYVMDDKNWEKLANYCPGIGQGKELTENEVAEFLNEQIMSDVL